MFVAIPIRIRLGKEVTIETICQQQSSSSLLGELILIWNWCYFHSSRFIIIGCCCSHLPSIFITQVEDGHQTIPFQSNHKPNLVKLRKCIISSLILMVGDAIGGYLCCPPNRRWFCLCKFSIIISAASPFARVPCWLPAVWDSMRKISL